MVNSSFFWLMSTSPTARQQIIESLNALPEESLSELMNFIEYLRYKSLQKKQDKPQTNFLLSVAAIGSSGKDNTSERDEEILGSEIDPVYGWNLKSGNSK